MSFVHTVAASARELLVSGKLQTSAGAVATVLDQSALVGTLVGTDESAVVAQALSVLDGYGPLEPLIQDSNIEEIWANRPDEIFIATPDGVARLHVELSQDQLRTILLRMLRHSGRRIDRTLPFADAALPDGSRLHVVIPEVTSQHWSFNLRKFPSRLFTLADLVQRQSLTTAQADLLSGAVRAGQNILISGATHAGKTTMLCALLNELPATTRLVTCEETFEIRSNLVDWVAMQTRQPNLEGQGEIALRRLVKEALRMRPGCLVIGEVREAEALDLLIGMNSGLPGLCTIHANSAQAALTKLSTLPLLAGPNISSHFVQATINASINLVVQCSNNPQRGRWVSSICRVTQDAAGLPIAVEVVQ